MKRRRPKKFRMVEVKDLSFLYERGRCSWLGCEWRHFRLKKRLKKADIVLAANEKVAADVHKYYRFPTDHTVIGTK